MPRNVFYRDFTICKAVALVALMGLAAALGSARDRQEAMQDDGTAEAMLIPAMVYSVWPECDTAKVGIDL